jgi:hypothetical protein
MSTSAPVTPPASLLLAREGGAELPVGAALDVVRLPLVLAMKKRPGTAEEDEDPGAALDDEQLGALPVLPEELYELRHLYTDRFGAQHRVFVSGHNRLGLPYGQDGDVLVALFKLIDEDRQRVLAGHAPRVVDGEFVGVTVRMIARAMGHENVHGRLMRRIRSALRRLAFVRILTTTTEFREAGDAAAALLAGAPGARPLVPGRGRVPERAGARGARGEAAAPSAREEEVSWLVEYRWRTEYLRNADGENWIVQLRLNPRWFNQAVSGWVAWIDTQRYRALRAPLAKRLYQLMAVEAAYGTPAPWTFPLEQLRRACAMSERRQANEIVRSLRDAAAELVDAGVLSAFEHRKIRRGEHEVTLVPGDALLLASLLRGVGAADLHETRVQLAFLRAFGVDASVARTLVEGDAAAVHEALLYALFLRETAPHEVQRSWSRMLVDRVEQKRSNAGVVGFESWLRKRRASLAADAAARPSAVRAALPAESAEPSLPPVVLSDDAWGRALARLRPTEPDSVFRAFLAETELLAEDGETVVVRAPSDFHAEKIVRSWGARLETLLAEELGRAVRLQVNGLRRTMFE